MDEDDQHFFFVSATNALRWARDAMTQDLTYHRVRKGLWERFISYVNHPRNREIELAVDYWFPLFRQFLTARNEALTDNVRYAFDVGVQELREAARLTARLGGAPATPAELEEAAATTPEE